MLTERVARDPVPLRDDVAALLAESDRRDRELRARLDAWRAGYDRGRAGAEAEMTERWNEIARAAIAGPSRAEVEARRWSVRGEQRTHRTFGAPHRDDHGREAA